MPSGNDEIQTLIRALNHPGERGPRRAVEALVAHGHQAAPALVDALGSSNNARIRRWAAVALGEIGYEPAFSVLKSSLADPSMSVRLNSLKALATLRGEEFDWTPVIRPLLTDPSAGLRVNALALVARFEVADVGQEVADLLIDPKWQVRLYAVRAMEVLAARGAGEIASALRKLENDPNMAVRRAATRALVAVMGQAA